MALKQKQATGTIGESISIPLKTFSAPTKHLKIHHGLRVTKTTLHTSLLTSAKVLPTEMRLYLRSSSLIRSLRLHPQLTFFVKNGSGLSTPIDSCWRHGVMHPINSTKCSCLNRMSELQSSPSPTCVSCGNVLNSLRLRSSIARLMKNLGYPTSEQLNPPSQKTSLSLSLNSPNGSTSYKLELPSHMLKPKY